MPHDLVFLSHSNIEKDKKLIDYLCKRAIDLKIRLYVAEREPEYENKIDHKIEEKLEESFCVLALYTSCASKSGFVNQEIGYAKKSRIPRIFICEEGTKPVGFSYGQEPILLDRENPEKALGRALKYIKKNETRFKSLLLSSTQLFGFKMAAYLDMNKKNYKEPRLFRPYGPMAVDFEKGYVYIRPEIKEIIKRLEKERILFVAGTPGAGKTVILHSIGYSLLKDFNSQVYIVPLKEDKRVNKDVIQHLPEDTVIILDDCHLDVSYTEELLRPPLPGCFLIFSSRPLEPPWSAEEKIGTRCELYEREKNAIRVEPKYAAEEIIELFSRKKKLKIPKETKNLLLEKYCPNLMLLSWALNTYEKCKSVEKRKIYEVVSNWLYPLYNIDGFYADLKEKDRKKIKERKAVEIFLYLSAFYQYEIPVSRQNLTEFLEIEDDGNSEISILLKSKTISGDREYIGLPHSAIAKLFIQSSENISILKRITESLKSRIKLDYRNLVWDDALLYSYMRRFPEKVNYFIEQLPEDLLDKIQKVPDFPILLKDVFEKSEYFSWNCYSIYTRKISRVKLKKVNGITSRKFEEKIKRWNTSEHIAYLLRTLKEIGYKNIDELDLLVFEEKIKRWCNISDITFLLVTLKGLDYMKIDELLDRLEPSVFEKKIKKCDDSDAIVELLKALKKINYKKINELEPSIFEEKVKKWGLKKWREPIIYHAELVNVYETQAIALLLETLKVINYTKINELLERLEPSLFEEKVKKWYSPQHIVYFYKTLKRIAYKRIDELLEKLEPGFIAKIVKNWWNEYDNERLLKTLEELNYPHHQRLTELIK